MTYQKLLSYTRKAVDDYQMIRSGDRIAVGVSGGKDSLTLALALKGLQRFYPEKFEVMAFTVSLGFPEFDVSGIRALMKEYEIPYSLIQTEIGSIVFEDRKESNPCSLCAKMRKGAFNDFAKQQGCNKVALGHHKEDAVETLFMSLFYEGRIHTFAPVTYWDRTQLYAIRPLIYTPEADIIAFAQNMNLPIVKNPCPADGNTKRGEIKERLHNWNREIGKTTQRAFRAIQDSAIPGWKLEGPQK